MTTKKFWQAFIVTTVSFISLSAWAVPGLINYQGKLTDAGSSVLTGTYSMVFSLYGTQTGGTALWTETQSVPVTDGIFHVQLGTATPLPVGVFDYNELYLEVVIDSEALTPRQRITSTAFAMKAADAELAVDADTVDGRHASEFLDASPVTQTKTGGLNIGGSVGIGIDTPTEMLTVAGVIESTTSGFKFPDGTVQATAAGSGSGDGHSLDAADGDPVDAVYVDEAGNVGIGSMWPSAKLDVHGGQNIGLSVVTDGFGAGYFHNNSSTNNAYAVQAYSMTWTGATRSLYAYNKSSSGTAVYGYAENSSGTTYAIYGKANSSSGFAGYFEGGKNYFSGNVGIGTASPAYKLHVEGDIRVNGDINMTTVDREIRLSTGRIISQSVPNRLTVESFVAGQPLFLRGPGGIQFYTGSESMRITGTGNVGIGTTSPSQRLDVAGSVIANSYLYHSDARLKKNVTSIDHALDKVSALHGVEFEWRTEEFPEKGFAEGRKIGLIAQEVEKVLPEAVSYDNEGYMTVEYANIIGVLVEGVKELKSQNDDLRAQNEGLRMLIGQMLTRIEALESRISH
ncbi:MAG: tail fiber domain-containing protein [bacterium]